MKNNKYLCAFLGIAASVLSVALIDLQSRTHAQSVGGGISLPPSVSSIQGMPGPFLNFSGKNLPHWRPALAKMRDGQADARILFVGDSTTNGTGGTHTTNVNADSFAYRVSYLLNARGTPSQPGLMVANTGSTRISLGSGWSNSSFGFGGITNSAWTSSGTTGNLVITPGGGYTYDKFQLYYLQYGTGGTITATATGGTPAVQNTTGANSITSFTATAASASTSNAVTITATGGEVWIIGIEPFLSTSTHVRVANVGAGGSSAVGWTTDDPTFGSIPSIKAYAPDLTFIDLGINDAGASESVATYIAAMKILITTAQISGDVVLVTMAPSSGTPYTTYEPQYVAAINALAVSLNLPLVDIYNRFGATYQSSLMFDSLHCTNLGYWDIGSAIVAGVQNATLVDAGGRDFIANSAVAGRVGFASRKRILE